MGNGAEFYDQHKSRQFNSMQNTKNIFIDPKRRTPGKGKSCLRIQSFLVFEQQSLTLESVNVTVW